MLLDINKIEIIRTGINCRHCGGNLVINKQRSWALKLLNLVRFKQYAPEQYECTDCHQKYIVISTS